MTKAGKGWSLIKTCFEPNCRVPLHEAKVSKTTSNTDTTVSGSLRSESDSDNESWAAWWYLMMRSFHGQDMSQCVNEMNITVCIFIYNIYIYIYIYTCKRQHVAPYCCYHMYTSWRKYRGPVINQLWELHELRLMIWCWCCFTMLMFGNMCSLFFDWLYLTVYVYIYTYT